MNRSFFKFVPFERIDILRQGMIRFSPVEELNDPFEALPSITYFTDKKWELFYKIVEKISREKRDPTPKEEDIIYSCIPQEHNNIEEFFTSEDYTFSDKRFFQLEEYKKKLRKHISKFGVLSLISSDDVSPNISIVIGYPNDPRRNLLMWSHYTNAHKGFVIEFRDGFINSSPQKVIYTNERPILTFEDIDNFVPSSYLIKSREWEYENEYRAFARLSEAEESQYSLFKFDKTKVKSVTLGCKMPKENRDEIISLLQNTPEYKNADIFIAQERDDEFSLDFFQKVGSFMNAMRTLSEDGKENLISPIISIRPQKKP